jgi:hypothetical protein
MKRIIQASLVAALALSGVQAASVDAKISSLEAELADLKKQVKKQNKKINEVKAHDSGDNIKWGVDFRTAYDNLNYDMADGNSRGNDSLYSMRLWLNMAYAPDQHNVFKGQLSMNKAFGADFGGYDSSMNRAFSLGGMFDWTANEALTDNNLKVRQAYWLYLGDKAFGADMPWTFSLGRRPSTNGFLANLSQDDPAQSPLAHVINVEFDGLSSKLDLSKVTGIPGMSIKLCMGYGSSNAAPMFDRIDGTQYSEDEDVLQDIKLAGFIFEPYNDGQYIVKATWYRAFDLPGFDDQAFMDAFMANNMSAGSFSQSGDMDGAAVSVLIDGITEDGYFADAKLFGSFGWSNTRPNDGQSMLGSVDNESGTSYWVGAYLPVADGDGENYGTVGAEFNHGSKYWRPFTYAEDTMIGSKMAARGDAWELNYTYQINEALSLQARYVNIDYDYTGSNSFFGADGTPMKIDDIKDGAAAWQQLGGTSDQASGMTVYQNLAMAQGMDPMDPATQAALMPTVQNMGMAAAFAPSIVEAAQDFRVYLRYRF